MQYLTKNCLSSVTFSQDNLAKIIQNLHSSNADGHDNFRISMLKLSVPAFFKPLVVSFK